MQGVKSVCKGLANYERHVGTESVGAKSLASMLRLEGRVAELLAKIQRMEAKNAGDVTEGLPGLKVELKGGGSRGDEGGEARTLNPLSSPGEDAAQPREPSTPPTGGVEGKLLTLRIEHEAAQVRLPALSSCGRIHG